MRDELKKHTLFLRYGDFDYLTSVYKQQNLPASEAIRLLVSKYVDRLRAQEQSSAVDLGEL